MQKKYKILLLIIVLLYPCYKGIRELFWVERDSYTIDKTLTFTARVDAGIMGFQDVEYDKAITITNLESKATLTISYVSLEPGVYFFIDTANSKKVLSVADHFAGQNFYDLQTLQLLGSTDCLTGFGGCGGFEVSRMAPSVHLYMVYDKDGFHR